MRDPETQHAATQIETLLATHKALAKIHDVQDTLDRIEDRQERAERSIVQVTHTFERKWENAERAYAHGIASDTALKNQHAELLKEVKRFRAVGLAVIFGSGIVSQTELLTFFTRIFG